MLYYLGQLINLIHSLISFLSYGNPTKYHGRSKSSENLQSQYTGYRYNLAGGAAPNVIHGVHSQFHLIDYQYQYRLPIALT